MADGPRPGDWRHQGPPSAPKAGGRAWQGQSSAATKAPRAPMSRGTKLGLAVGSLSLLLALLIVVLRWLIPIKPACLILLGAGYEENLNLPANVYGWNSLLEMEKLADKSGIVSSILPWGHSGKLRLAFGPRSVDRATPWEKVWAEVPRSFDEKTAVIVLSLEGGTDTRGPYLLANDPRGQERIPLEKVLQDLNGPQFQEKNKLLILDTTQVQAHWSSGLLLNDFVRQLKALEKKIQEQPNLVVISASDVDQVSWYSPEWRRNIFLHYVIEGLKGAADSNGNARVTALELYQYVKDKVKTWVQANREAVQVPILLGGEERAADIDLVQIEEAYVEPSPASAPGASFVPPTELASAWQECQGLREATPSPAVYSPQLWRQYQDTLLRYEYLLCAGDPTQKAGDLKNSLAKLREAIVAGSRLDQAQFPVGATLPMAQALGVKKNWSSKDLSTKLDVLWDADAGEPRRQAWDKIKAWASTEGQDDRNTRHLLQTQLAGGLFNLLIRKTNLTAKDLGPPLTTEKGEGEKQECRARSLLRLIEELGGPRSAEAHFLVMLLHDLDPAGPFQLADLKQALELRLLAEQAAFSIPQESRLGHPYSEYVFPWIRTKVERADDNRRRGEDWLFGSTETAHAEALKFQQLAKTLFEESRTDADLIRQALDLRDRVLADLFYYAQWLGRQRLPGDQKSDQKIQLLIDQVERLAKNVQALNNRLELSFTPGEPLTPAPLPIRGRGESGKGLLEMVPDDDDNPQRLPLKGILQNLIARIRADYSDPDKGLQAAFRRVCSGLQEVHLQSRWHEIEDALSVPLLDDPGTRMTLLRNSRGYSSQLNAGSLKPATVALEDVPGRVKEQTLRQQRLALAVLYRFGKDISTGSGGEGWREDVIKTGQEIGKFWQQLPDVINKDLADSLVAGDLRKSLPPLLDGDFRCRLIHGGGAALLEADPFGTPEGLRRLRLHDFLLWQARRTLTDHWYAEPDSLEKTFYQPAAQAYLRTARRLAESKSDDVDLNKKRQAEVSKVEAELKPAGVQVENLSQPYWTSELRFPLRWKLNPQEGLPPGIPMTWLKAENPFQITDKFTGRKPLENWLPETIGYKLEKPAEGVSSRGAATLHVLYRGQRQGILQDIRLYREPDTIAYEVPPPKKAALALRMDKNFTYGAVCIVLDTSSSMRFKHQNKERWDFSVQALEVALDVIPDGTKLSLLAFDNDKDKTVPVVVQPALDWKVARDKEDLMVKVARLKPPENGIATPLAKSLVLARDRGFPQNFQGPRVVLVLTDGDDTVSMDGHPYPRNPEQQGRYNKALRAFLEEQLNFKGIEVQMVLFNDSRDEEGKKEAKNAEEQFHQFLQDMTPPGTFVLQPDGSQLAATLEHAIRPSLKLLQGNRLVTRFPTLYANFPGRETEWGLVEPGSYEAVVYKRPQNLNLEPGDLLELTLKNQDSQVVLERSLLGQESRYKLVSQEKGDWLVSVMQNQVELRTGLVRQLVTFEETHNQFKPGDLLKQIQPGFLWMEVSPRGGEKKPGQLRWFKEYIYPAPAFRLTTRDWPFRDEQPLPADVKVWWSRKKFLDNEAFTYFLERSSPKIGQPLKVGATNFTIESIEVEEHPIAEAPWSEDRTRKRCVVVRVAHDPGKPVWIQLRSDRAPAGEEHHYYEGVSKYTAFFWGLRNPDTDSFSLQVVSLESFKNAGAPLTFSLPPPTTTPGPAPYLKLIQDH